MGPLQGNVPGQMEIGSLTKIAAASQKPDPCAETGDSPPGPPARGKSDTLRGSIFGNTGAVLPCLQASEPTAPRPSHHEGSKPRAGLASGAWVPGEKEAKSQWSCPPFPQGRHFLYRSSCI